MAILTSQRIWTWIESNTFGSDNGLDKAAKAFGPTGSKSGGVPGSDGAGFTYNSPSHVYSPPAGGTADDPYLTDQFHQSSSVKKGLAGEEITGNYGPTVYGPNNFGRLGPNHNTLLTSLAKLNANQAQLNSADYPAHDYFDTRQPRALRSYFEDAGSSDPKWQKGYDGAHLYPERAVTTSTSETVAAPVATITTGLRHWLTNTPGDSGTQGTDEAFDSFTTDFKTYDTKQEAVQFLDIFTQILAAIDAGDADSTDMNMADRYEHRALLKALSASDGE